MGRKKNKPNNSSVIFEYICSNCSNKMFLPRRKSNINGPTAIRKIYCPVCKKVTVFKQGEQI